LINKNMSRDGGNAYGSGGRYEVKKFKPFTKGATLHQTEDNSWVEDEKKEQAVKAEVKSEHTGEILAPGEKPLAEILQGKNPILFCHEAAKFHHLKLEFDPVSETGGQFTWSLTMGEMNTEGLGKSRKIAKIRAAEEMVRLLDLTYPGIGIVVATKSGVGPGRHTDGYGATYMPTKAPTSELAMVQNKERKSRFKEQNLKAIQNQRDMRKGASNPYGTCPYGARPETDPKYNGGANPISRLAEYSRRMKWPEPVFTVKYENVLDQYKSNQALRRTAQGEERGFTIKKIEYTIECEFQGKTFTGTSLKKKDAKNIAAEAAYAEFGPKQPGAGTSGFKQGSDLKVEVKTEDLIQKLKN